MLILGISGAGQHRTHVAHAFALDTHSKTAIVYFYYVLMMRRLPPHRKREHAVHVLVVFSLLVLAGCAPRYRYVTHSGKTPEGRMCEMQAQRARDYCARGVRGCENGESKNKRCRRCWDEYREAFATCGGSIDRVCVKNCDGVEDQKLANQTQD